MTAFLPSRVRLEAVEPYRIPQFERSAYLRLDINEHPGGAPDFVVQAVRAALDAQALATYPVYAQWHAEAARYFGVQPDQLTCTAGGDEAIKAICEAHLLPGTALLTVEPGYDMFKIWAQLYGNPLRGVRLGPGFAFDADAWLQALTPDVGLVALVTPNNPTGTVVPGSIVAETLRRVRCPVVIDETYAEFVGRSVADLLPAHPHLFVIRSFSKVHGLAGLRAGAVLSQAQNVEALRRVLNPFNVNRAAIAASLAVMRHPEPTRAHVAEVTAARTQFVQDLATIGVQTGPANANFVLADLGDDAGHCTERLAAEGILVRNRTGTHPLLAGHVRVAIGSPAQMRRCFGALRKVVVPPPRIDTLLFDFDGPLVDVSGSYRRAVLETARSLLVDARAPAQVLDQVTNERVEQLKRRGGLNNDWDCTAELLQELGQATDYDEIVELFQSLYWGTDGSDGFIAHEPWLVAPEVLERIATRFRTALVTGRPRREALWTLQHRDAARIWPTLVAMEDMTAQKPAPDGLFQALGLLHGTGPHVPAADLAERAAYVGDSVDDMRAAVAAGVLPLGVLPATAQWHDGLVERLYEAGAYAVFRDVAEVVAWLR